MYFQALNPTAGAGLDVPLPDDAAPRLLVQTNPQIGPATKIGLPVPTPEPVERQPARLGPTGDGTSVKKSPIDQGGGGEGAEFPWYQPDALLKTDDTAEVPWYRKGWGIGLLIGIGVLVAGGAFYYIATREE